MALLNQTVIVKVISDKVMVRYECDGETFAFILNNASAMQLSGALEQAAKSKGAYATSINIG